MAEVDQLTDVWARVSYLARESDSFRLRLMSMPTVVLNENGAALPLNLYVNIVDDGRIAPGSWEMRRHGDKTSLWLGLPAKVCAQAKQPVRSSGR